MPEYVYALHDFAPENEDEVSFQAGERIEVVEKDDFYGDGWWQGRNLMGRVGLFPVSYTTPAAPSAIGSTAAPADDSIPETEPEATALGLEANYKNIVAPVPKAAPAKFLNGNHDFSELQPAGNEVMEVTLTDVEEAISQIGRNHNNNNDDHSSDTRDDRDTDTDIGLSDVDGVGDANDAEGWHKRTRMTLAEKARRAVEEAEKLEAMMSGLDVDSEHRSAAPPIEVELSDESEDEVEGEELTAHAGAFHGIPEEDEGVESDGGLLEAQMKSDAADTPDPIRENNATFQRIWFRPRALRGDWSTTTPEQSNVLSSTGEEVDSLPLPENQEIQLEMAMAAPLPAPNMALSYAQIPELHSTSNPTSSLLISANVRDDTKPGSPGPMLVFEPTYTSTPVRSSTSSPSPATSAPTAQNLAPAALQRDLVHPNHHNVTSSLSPNTTTPPPPVFVPDPTPSIEAQSSTTTTIIASNADAISPPPSATFSAITSRKKKKDKLPSEWTLEDVVDWLKVKGFDQDVCEKFIEQEITGDVLLELDVNLLKTEIGIMAFGKRVRISNAIAELRRPPSTTSSDHTELSPMTPPLASIPVSHPQTHSRTQSQPYAPHSFPGNGHAYSQSIQGSLGGPLGFPGGETAAITNGYGQLTASDGSVMVGGLFAESLPSQDVSGDFVYVMKGGDGVEVHGGGVGLGVSNDGGLLSHSVQLPLSPSDGATQDSVVTDALRSEPVEAEERPEGRGHMSEGEVAPTSRVRRKLFGRSHDSASSSLRHRKDTSLLDSTAKEMLDGGGKDKDGGTIISRRGKSKRSIDSGKGGDRLSIFGGAFGGSLSKGRKPPPSVDDAHASQSEKSSSLFSLPRLHSNTVRKPSSTHRSLTPNGSPKKDSSDTREQQDPPAKREKAKTTKEKDVKDPTLLRKRTSSSSSGNHTTAAAMNGDGASPTGIVRPGKSILEQIGEPDHAGWMRKRGDRYNSWKARYLLLKGPHMYCLRNDNKSETKIKGYINIIGYKVSVDENLDPGRYGFRIDHDHDRTHYFSSDEKVIVRDWMKAIMKATIDRDYTKPVVSSCNIPTIPLTVAQTMNPAPRPPSPMARAATQKALRRENPDQLSTRDAQVLMGFSANPDGNDGRTSFDLLFTNQDVGTPVSPDHDQGQNAVPTPTTGKSMTAPPRPSREMRRASSTRSSTLVGHGGDVLIEWANAHLPPSLRVTDSSRSELYSGLALLRLAESIKGKSSNPPVPDSAFPADASDEKLDGLFRLFDFLLDNDVKIGNVSINDVRQRRGDKVLQLLKALKAWEDKRKAIMQSIGKPPVQVSGFIGPIWA